MRADRPVLDGLTVRTATVHDVEALVRFSFALAGETEGRRLDERRLREGTQAVLTSTEHGFYLVAEWRDAQAVTVIGQLLIDQNAGAHSDRTSAD